MNVENELYPDWDISYKPHEGTVAWYLEKMRYFQDNLDVWIDPDMDDEEIPAVS